jgi:hypothetical protein
MKRALNNTLLRRLPFLGGLGMEWLSVRRWSSTDSISWETWGASRPSIESYLAALCHGLSKMAVGTV